MQIYANLETQSRAQYRRLVLDKEKPDCVIFVCWQFSPRDVASWVSSAANHAPLPILPFEGHIQTLNLPRLYYWMPNVAWN